MIWPFLANSEEENPVEVMIRERSCPNPSAHNNVFFLQIFSKFSLTPLIIYVHIFLFFSLWYFCLCYQLKGTAAQIFIFHTLLSFLGEREREITITLNKSIWDCNEYKQHTYKYRIRKISNRIRFERGFL